MFGLSLRGRLQKVWKIAHRVCAARERKHTMAEDKKNARSQHHIILEDRRLLSITGVTDIDSFDEEMVAVYTDSGELLVRGVDLHINRIDLDTGELSVEGDIASLEYSDNQSARGGLWSKLFR